MTWAKPSPQARAGLSSVSRRRTAGRRLGRSSAMYRTEINMYPTSSATEQTAAATWVHLWKWFRSVQIREQSWGVMHLFHPTSNCRQSTPCKGLCQVLWRRQTQLRLALSPMPASRVHRSTSLSLPVPCAVFLPQQHCLPKRTSELPGLGAFFPFCILWKDEPGTSAQGICSEPVRAFLGKQDSSSPRILPVVAGSVSRWDGGGKKDLLLEVRGRGKIQG